MLLLKNLNRGLLLKVRRYKGQVDSYRQNRPFENNQRQKAVL